MPSIKSGESYYTIGDGAVCLAHRAGTKSLYDQIAVAYIVTSTKKLSLELHNQ